MKSSKKIVSRIEEVQRTEGPACDTEVLGLGRGGYASLAVFLCSSARYRKDAHSSAVTKKMITHGQRAEKQQQVTTTS